MKRQFASDKYTGICPEGWEAGSFVALLEEVTGMAGRDQVLCIAIYEVDNGLIQRLWLGS
jgi:hypothetical protein